jgi:uncharacterized protein (TIGR02594 family)
MKLEVTAYDIAQRYVGIKEISGAKNHPLVQWWLSLCGFSLDTPDEVPWCSAFINGVAWELRLPRSKSAAARSWLNIGVPMPLEGAEAGFDVVILKRGGAPQPGPEVIDAPGHVGFFAGLDWDLKRILVLGGNQGNSVSIGSFPVDSLLGLRRLAG